MTSEETQKLFSSLPVEEQLAIQRRYQSEFSPTLKVLNEEDGDASGRNRKRTLEMGHHAQVDIIPPSVWKQVEANEEFDKNMAQADPDHQEWGFADRNRSSLFFS